MGGFCLVIEKEMCQTFCEIVMVLSVEIMCVGCHVGGVILKMLKDAYILFSIERI